MRARVFNLPFRREARGFDGTALVEFLERHRAARISEHFFTLDGQPFLSCFVQWSDADGELAAPSAPGTRRGERSRETTVELDDTGRRVAGALRAWRAERARELGVPAYRILTNRQVDVLALARPSDASTLPELDGIGAQTLALHGERIVAAIRGARAASG